jgi:hypothetical protein
MLLELCEDICLIMANHFQEGFNHGLQDWPVRQLGKHPWMQGSILVKGNYFLLPLLLLLCSSFVTAATATAIGIFIGVIVMVILLNVRLPPIQTVMMELLVTTHETHRHESNKNHKNCDPNFPPPLLPPPPLQCSSSPSSAATAAILILPVIAFIVTILLICIA